MQSEISSKNCQEAYAVTGFPPSTAFDDVLARLISLANDKRVRGDIMSKPHQVKKSNYLQCRTDKTLCRIPCPKCKYSAGFSKLFKSTENLWRHLHQIHRLDKNVFPSTDYVIQVLEKISLAVEKGDRLEGIPDAVRLGMVIK